MPKKGSLQAAFFISYGLKLRIACFFSLILIGTSWFIPNHYLPWLSFYNEAGMALGVGLLGSVYFFQRKNELTFPMSVLWVAAVACVPILQAGSGLIILPGVGWLVGLYIIGFALCMVVGWNLLDCHGTSVLRLMGLVLVFSAIATVGIELHQWLQLRFLGDWVVDLMPGGRPYGNLAQPNHTATLLFLGMIGAWILCHQALIKTNVLIISVGFMGLGIALTKSRTGWVECIFLILAIAWMKKKFWFSTKYSALLLMSLLLSLMIVAWPFIDHLIMPGPIFSTNPAEGMRLKVGTRPDHWLILLGAIMHRPWLGYGWGQVSQAHLLVAMDHPFMSETQAHSHNFLLDLLVWNGLPLGVMMGLGLVYWFYRNLRKCRDANSAFLLAGIGGVCIHGLLEYPLEYSYFLFPVGLMAGAVERLNFSTQGVVTVPAWWPRLVFIGALSAAGLTIFEYRAVENSYRNWRLFDSRVEGATLQRVPDVLFLTHMKDFLIVLRSDPYAGMTDLELVRLRAIAMRYASPSLLLKHASASGLNKNPRAAIDALGMLCKRYPRNVCALQIRRWKNQASNKYPLLQEIKLPPDLESLGR